MVNLEYQKKYFENHQAKLYDYGNIKVLDFKNPKSNVYRIRFIFEEDYCRLHISGDLGELIACNYYNMTFDKFYDFVDNVGYFEGKIECHSRKLYYYDEDRAREELRKYLYDNELVEEIVEDSSHIYEESEEEIINEFVDDVMESFDNEHGISVEGCELVANYFGDAYEDCYYFGKERTGIIELYLFAFRLAMKQLKENGYDEFRKRETKNQSDVS